MEKNTLHVYILFTHEFVTSLLSGSFHFPFFVFLVKVTKNEKNQLSYLFIFCEKITFCLKITADFWSLWPKNEKWNELDIKSLEILLLKGNFRKP